MIHEPKPIELTIEVDPEGLRDIEDVKERLGSPNIATALYNAVSLLRTLYRYQDRGFEIRLVKDGEEHRFKLPTK